MDRLASSKGRSDREAMFQETANELGRSATVVEKDFWVCWTLSRLFGPLAATALPKLCFKGGTSLSKAYGLIERFSEDIDLSIDRSTLLRPEETDPLKFEGSKNQRKKLVETLRERAAGRLGDDLLAAMRGDFESILGDANWSVDVDAGDPLTLLFSYPASFPQVDGSQIKPFVRLEFGVSDQEPNERIKIAPDAARLFPDLFEISSSCDVTVLSACRTFWEKATILHEYYHRSLAGDVSVLAASRHYYDLYRLASSLEAAAWTADKEMRRAVVAFKEIFFPRAAARYREALPGSHLRLAPHDDWAARLRPDYEQLRTEMIFGEAPAFAALCSSLADLEEQIRAADR